MAKRLAPSGRQKLEKEICHNISLLRDNTDDCEDYIAELEAMLRQQKSETEAAKSALADSNNKLAQATGRIEAQKDDIQTMRTDAKLAALQQAASDKELAGLQTQLQDALNDGQLFADELRSKLAAEQKANEAELERRDALEKEISNKFEAAEAARVEQVAVSEALKEELDQLHLTINEYRECDTALRERIAVLEQLLSEERKKAGQDLLLRIMELETMLESERTKVDDLDEMPTVVHVSHASALKPSVTKTTTTTSSISSQKKSNKRNNG